MHFNIKNVEKLEVYFFSFDKSLSISNQLSKELNHLCSLNTSIIKETNKTIIHENMKNRINKLIKKKKLKEMKSSIFKNHVINKK